MESGKTTHQAGQTPSPDSVKRLFLGIEIPEAARQNLHAIQQSYATLSGIRWTPTANLHLTVFFFGMVPIDMVPNLCSLIQLGLAEATPFDLSFDRYLFAPRPRDPRMIWARYHKAEPFKELVHHIGTLYSQITSQQVLRKSPIPHITLARFKGFQPPGPIRFETFASPGNLQAATLTLWESQLSTQGARYFPITQFDL